MSLDEKLTLVRTHFGVPLHGRPAPFGAIGSAGFAPGVPRLGVPALQETDAGLGIANPTDAPFDATAMPSALATASTFDPALAEDAGRAIGAEARAMGFDVLLGGGANLVREPRGGRDFEYVSEDPLLTGIMAGAAVRGIQSQGVVATLKHFALNAQENGRVLYDAHIGEAAARESDLLAFEIAVEQGCPGAVLASYNRVNGSYASENRHLLTEVLKDDWRFPGWVMSDWGATHSTVAAARAGLDQESGVEEDSEVFFGAALQSAIAGGEVDDGRLDDMVRRILRSRSVAGQLDGIPRVDATRRVSPSDLAAHAAMARRVAEQGIVLLKNDGDLLPLMGAHRVLVVGGHADLGVLSGGGSSQVVPQGSIRFEGEPARLFWGRPRLYDPSPPLAALRRALPDVDIGFADGQDIGHAADMARAADVAIVFAGQWSNESRDSPDLSLPGAQDPLIAAVAARNPRTIVVLETGHAVTMPWLAAVPAVIEAWYPGERGGDAIAAVLTGAVDPSGRLPISFPVDETQLPRPGLPRREDTTSNPDEPVRGIPFTVDYDIEGADVGYKWDLRTGATPLFPFGYGLSYTRFVIDKVAADAAGGTIDVGFDVTNIGKRAGIDTPQVFVDGDRFTRRLVGWVRADLQPGETRHFSARVDPRLLARYDVGAHAWRIAAGAYRIAVRTNALADAPTVKVSLPLHSFPARHGEATAN